MSIIKHYKKTGTALAKLWRKFVILYFLLFISRFLFILAFQPASTNPILQSVSDTIRTQITATNVQLNTLFLVGGFIIVGLILLSFLSLFPLALIVSIVKNRSKKTSILDDLAQTAIRFIPLTTTWTLVIGIILLTSLLIVPGIIAALFLAFAPFVVIYEKKKNVDALKQSVFVITHHLGKIIVHTLAFKIPANVVLFIVSFGVQRFIPLYTGSILKTLLILYLTIDFTYFTILYEDVRKK